MSELERIAIEGVEARGEVYLQGAHVTRWTTANERPVLFLSEKSLFVHGKAIRGGVPVIFPWFGARGGGLPGPQHGFARSMEWEREESSDPATVQLVLKPNDAIRSFGYDHFLTRFRVSFGAALQMELETHNHGTAEMVFEEALHTYFSIADISRVCVTGLEGVTYIDKTAANERKLQGDHSIRFAKETDSVYLNTTSACVIHDEVWQRRIRVEKSGSHSTVVWNPWAEKTRGMADMGPDEWPHFVCVETANAADNAIHLAPGASHTLTTRISVEH